MRFDQVKSALDAAAQGGLLTAVVNGTQTTYQVGTGFALSQVLTDLPPVYALGSSPDEPQPDLLTTLGIHASTLIVDEAALTVRFEGSLSPPALVADLLGFGGISGSIAISGTASFSTDAPPTDGGVAALLDPTSAPGFLLEADASFAALTFLPLEEAYLRVYTPLSRDWLAQNPDFEPCAWLGARMKISDDVSIDVYTVVPLGATPDTLSFHARSSPIPLPSLDSLARLVGADGVASALPSGLDPGSLGALEVRDVSVAIALTNPRITSAGIVVGTSGSWTPVEGILAVEKPVVVFRVVEPFDAQARGAYASLTGTLKVAGQPLQFATSVPDFYLSAKMDESLTLPLSSLSDSYDFLPSIGNLTIDALGFEAWPLATPARYTLSASLAAEPEAWSIDVGNVSLTFSDVMLGLDYTGGSGLAGRFRGKADLDGVELAASLEFQQNGNATLRGELGPVSLTGLVKSLIGRALPLPDGFDLELGTSVLLLQKSGSAYSLALSTDVEKFGRLAFAIVENSGWGAAFGIALAKDFDWGSLAIPDFTTYVPLSSLTLIASTVALPQLPFPTPDQLGDDDDAPIALPPGILSVPQGIVLFATLAPDGSGDAGKGIQLLCNLLGLADATLSAAIVVSTTPSLSVSMSGTLNDVTHFTGSLQLAVGAEGPEVGLEGDFDIRMDEKKTLRCSSRLAVTAGGAYLSGGIQGSWVDALGVSGLTLSDLNLEIGVNWEGIPTLGIAGQLSVGQINGSLAVLFDSTTPSNSLLAASISDLPLGQVAVDLTSAALPAEIESVVSSIALSGIQLFFLPDTVADALDDGVMSSAIADAFKQASGGSIQLPAGDRDVLVVVGQQGARWYLTDRTTFIHYTVTRVTGSGLEVRKDLQFKIAPNGGKIGMATFPRGISVSGAVSAFGVDGSFDAAIDPAKGIYVDATLSPIQIADVLEITAADGRSGPLLSVATWDAPASSFRGPHIAVSGQADVLGISGTLDLFVDRKGMRFETSGTIFDVFQASLKATADLSSLSKASFTLTAQMHQDLMSQLEAASTQAVDDASRAAQDTLAQADKALSDAQAEVDRLNGQIDSTAASLRTDAEATLDNANLVVNTYQAQIDADVAEIARLSYDGIEWPWTAAEHAAKIAADVAEIAADGVLTLALQTAKSNQAAAQAAVDNATYLADAGYEALVKQLNDVAQPALLAAQLLVRDTRAQLGNLTATYDWIVANGLEDLVNVHSASFTGALGVVSGGRVRLQVSLTLTGTDYDLDTDNFDFRDVETAIATFASQVVALANGQPPASTPAPQPAFVVPALARIRVAGGVSGDRQYLSVSNDGSVTDLWGVDDESGRQHWRFQPGPDASWYNILVSGGVSGDSKYLSVNEEGSRVDLFGIDDGTGRQRWTVEVIDTGLVHLRLLQGVSTDRTYLSVPDDGTKVDLWNVDDASNRQRWRIEDVTGETGAGVGGDINIPEAFATAEPPDLIGGDNESLPDPDWDPLG